VAEEVCARAGRESDIVIGNDDEFGLMAGSKQRGLDLARQLARTTAAAVVYKMGAGGAITIAGTQELQTPVFAVRALKPTGAGDAFLGGFLAGLAAGRPLRDCVERGAATAAIVVARVGCAPSHRKSFSTGM